MLTLRNVTKRFGTITALDGVSLEIAPGEFFGLLGPNGAGKTTLMSLAAGLRTPEAGTIVLAGRPVASGASAARRALGLVPQTIALFPELTADENLRIFGELQGLRGAELRTRIDEAFAAAQLTDRRRSLVKTFSGGMQRRLNLVAALLHRPKLLLCDEPTVGVDPQSRNAIFDFLQRLNEQGKTIVYTTHYMEEAERLCSRIAIIDAGRIIALGTLSEIFEQFPGAEIILIEKNPSTVIHEALFREFGTVDDRNDHFAINPAAGLKLSAFFSRMEEHAINPKFIELSRPSLEDIFLSATGKRLRD